MALRRVAARLLLTLIGMVVLAPSAALAHDEPAPGRADPRDVEEARQLTDALRVGARSPSKGRSVRATVAGQAERRRDVLARVAERDPHAALDLALTPAERAALPPDARAFTEEWTDLTGELLVLHVDDEDGRGEYHVSLVDGGRGTKLRPGNGLRARPGDVVRVTGVRLPSDGSVVTDQVTTHRPITGTGPTGPQRTALILASAPGSGAHPYADKAATATMFFSTTSGVSARAWYDEVSYGQVQIVGASGGEGTAADVYGPYTLATATCDGGTIQREALPAADPELNFNQYDRIVILWSHAPCGNGGVASVRFASLGLYDGMAQYASVAWVFNRGFGAPGYNARIGGVALHEFGHNLGVWHANTLECGALAINGPTCSSGEYGDPADVMGSSGGLGHFNGLHKDTLGWLAGRAQTVGASGTYALDAYESPAGVKALKLPRTRDASGTVTAYYYLEYRKPSPTWSAYLNGRPSFGNGVLIHAGGALPTCDGYCGADFYGPGGGGDSNLIDATPASQPGGNDILDAPLMAGQQFSDPAAGVTVGVVATGPTSATVSVALAPPAPSIQSAVYPQGAGAVTGGGTVAVGQTVTLTAVPSPGYRFLRWRENRANRTYPNPYTFQVGADRYLEAIFEAGPAEPPANDAVASAAVLTALPATAQVNTRAATGDPGEATNVDQPLCDTHGGSVGKTVWWRVTPPAPTTISVATAGSSFDTVVTVSTGSGPGSLTRIACNDDAAGGRQSALSFAAGAGATYWIQVGGYNGESGDLHVQFGGTLAAGADLGVALEAGPADLLAGAPLTLSGRVTNTGPATATGATFSLALPAGATAVVPTTTAGSCAVTGGAVACQLGQLAAGQTARIAVALVPTAASRAELAATVGATEPDPNGANNRATVAPIVRPAACATRPPVRVSAAPSGDGRLLVTVTAGVGPLRTLRFGNATNAAVSVGTTAGARGNFSVDVPGNASTTGFVVQRAAPNAPVTVPLTVEDDCGPWETLVGGGPSAF